MYVLQLFFFSSFYAFKLLYITNINMTVNLLKCQEMSQTETRGTWDNTANLKYLAYERNKISPVFEIPAI